VKPIILLIENDDSYAQFLKKTLVDKNYEVVLSRSGLQALEKLEGKKVDIILSSYYLPNIRGDEFYTRIYELYPEIPIIFVSHEAHKKTIKNILSYPNADYMVKPIVISELLARIEVALEEHQKVGSSKTLKVQDLELDLKTFTAKRGEKEIELSPTEFSLLKYLIINKNMVLTRGMILSRIWGYNTDVSSRVVDVYIGYLRDKIDEGYEKKLIETVRGFGYTIKE
jgi:DNA-binding response OmpR family regulator